MHFFAVSGLLVAFSNLSMAIWVYLKGGNKKLNKHWAFFLLFAVIWGYGGYRYTTTLDKDSALLWARIAYVGVIFIPILFWHFVYTFLEIKQKKVLLALYALSFFFVTVNFVSRDLFLGDLGFIFSSFYWITSPGPVWYLFMAYWVGLLIYAEYKLFRASKTSSGLKRNQLKYFYFATLMGFVSGVTCFLPCFGIKLYPGIGNLGVSLYCIPMTYAITKYTIMDIKVAVTRTGIFVVVYTLLLGLPFAIAARFKYWFIDIFGDNWWLVPSGLIAALATLGPFIYIYFQRKAEDRLLKEQRNYHEVLKQAGMEMTRIRNLQTLLDLIVNIVSKNVRISHLEIYLYDDKNKYYSLRADYNQKKGRAVFISHESSIVTWLATQKEPLVYEEVKQKLEISPDPSLKEIKKEMEGLGAAVVVPSFLEGKLLNLLILGDKKFGRSYSPEDLTIFAILANQIAVGIENASLYENMEDQVRQRTKELVDVQKQLIQAEKMATVGTLAGGVAHEINNPLTAILTNVQMLLASSSIDDKLDRESLELIEEATKRCRTIVQKLMTYARKPLETTQITKINLLEVVKNVMSFIGYQLEQDNIKINIKAGDDAYFVMGNQNELEQVFTNILLNSRDAVKKVKKSGEVDIAFSITDDWVKIEIKDEGEGISDDIAAKIFDPFFTTKDIGRGVGLGLSICQAIVEKHKGSISFKSRAAEGTTFTILLPRIKKGVVMHVGSGKASA